MHKGWIVITKDNKVLIEEEIHWNKIDKGNIKALRLKWYDKMWELRDKNNYVQFKSATQALGEKLPTVLSRCIGYKEEDGTTVLMRVNEFNGLMKLEVK